MAISTYDELVKAVVAWSHRGDILPLVDDFIMLAENAMYDNEVEPLKVRSMGATTSLIIDGRVIALPDGFESARAIRLDLSGGELSFTTPEALNPVSGTGRPSRFTIVGDTIEFNISPDMDYTAVITYYKRADPLTKDNQTNEILSNHPAIYLNGAMLEAMIYAQDYDQQAIYKQRFINAIKGANKSDKRGRYGNAPVIKIDGGLRP